MCEPLFDYCTDCNLWTDTAAFSRQHPRHLILSRDEAYETKLRRFAGMLHQVSSGYLSRQEVAGILAEYERCYGTFQVNEKRQQV